MVGQSLNVSAVAAGGLVPHSVRNFCSSMHCAARRGGLGAAAVATLILTCPAPLIADRGLPVFKLYTAAAGVYRVGFEDLVAVGLDTGELPSSELGLTHRGHPVPVWMEDGGDGLFGPGDWIEFVGERPHGWVSYFDEHTRYSVYFLCFDTASPARMTSYRPARSPLGEGGFHRLRRRHHHEKNYLFFRQPPPANGRPDELWYWAKLTHADPEPFSYQLNLSDLATDKGRTVEVRIELRGWSEPADKPDSAVPDHRVDVRLNGEELASAEWNGRQSYLLVIPSVPAKRFVAGANTLELAIPKRAGGEDDRWLIDVVMLNWIEITYPRIEDIGGRGTDFELGDPLAARLIRLFRLREEEEFLIYGPAGGFRMALSAATQRPRGRKVVSVFRPPRFESSFIVVRPEHLKAPQAIVLDRPSRLSDIGNRADYIMIVHRRLLEAIRPLAEFHRSRGLDVLVVDVQDVYDEFDHGMAGPWALRTFLDHAYHRWQKPAPRFVLLVGDASWNGKDAYVRDASFADHTGGGGSRRIRRRRRDSGAEQPLDFNPYAAEAKLNNRNLIPTWDHTPMGRSASDNYFVAVDGDDVLPDMAIGRLSVVEPSEVTQIVDKVIAYSSQPEVGPWRRNVLFIANTDSRFQRHTDRQARDMAAMGFSTQKVYPALDDGGNEAHTQRLIESFDEGQLFVQFLGHGGRYIWQTGRRDLEKGRDLFGLEHLDQLASTSRLPVVLSMACFSAPFDHPEADSIGEKLLRLDGRGAIGIVAASSRNSPSVSWGLALFEELRQPGAAVGEAVMRAKHRVGYRGFVEKYNLMGDPAVPVALPAGEIALTAANGKGRRLTVRGAFDADAFSGELLVELLDAESEVLTSVARPLESAGFAVDLEASAEQLAAGVIVRAYAWDAALGVDALGVLDLAPDRPDGDEPDPDSGDAIRLPDGSRPVAALPQAAGAREIRGEAVAWWSFEETGGVEVLDRAGAHHGVVVDRAVRSSEGGRGAALRFNGHGFIHAGSDPELDLGTGDFTLHAWVKTRQARRQVWVILDKRAAAGYHLYNYWGHLGLQLGAGKFSNYEGPFIADGRWHHVAVTVDRDLADGIRWYVDGIEAGTRQDPTAHRGSLANPSPLSIGGRRTGGGNFVGALDEVGIFRRALTAGQVEQLYAGGWQVLAGDD